MRRHGGADAGTLLDRRSAGPQRHPHRSERRQHAAGHPARASPERVAGRCRLRARRRRAGRRVAVRRGRRLLRRRRAPRLSGDRRGGHGPLHDDLSRLVPGTHDPHPLPRPGVRRRRRRRRLRVAGLFRRRGERPGARSGPVRRPRPAQPYERRRCHLRRGAAAGARRGRQRRLHGHLRRRGEWCPGRRELMWRSLRMSRRRRGSSSRPGRGDDAQGRERGPRASPASSIGPAWRSIGQSRRRASASAGNTEKHAPRSRSCSPSRRQPTPAGPSRRSPMR